MAQILMHVVTDGDEKVHAAFLSYEEALGYVWMMFEPSDLEHAMAHIETCDCVISGHRYERALGGPQK